MTGPATADKREQIRQGALRAFARHGFHHTTAQQIAEEAGVAVGTLYNYFESKEAILIDIFETEKETRWRLIGEILGEPGPMRDKLRKILHLHVRRALENREVTRLLLGEEFHLDGALEACTHSVFKEIAERVAAMLQAAMDCGELRRADPALVAQALLGALRSVLARLCLYDDAEALRLRQIAAEELFHFIWNGLRPQGEADSSHLEAGFEEKPERLL